MGRKTLTITGTHLTELLSGGTKAYTVADHLPDDVTIVGASVRGTFVDLVIESDEFEPVADGQPCPRIQPVIFPWHTHRSPGNTA